MSILIIFFIWVQISCWIPTNHLISMFPKSLISGLKILWLFQLGSIYTICCVRSHGLYHYCYSREYIVTSFFILTHPRSNLHSKKLFFLCLALKRLFKAELVFVSVIGKTMKFSRDVQLKSKLWSDHRAWFSSSFSLFIKISLYS